jgi:hypothetical protein
MMLIKFILYLIIGELEIKFFYFCDNRHKFYV